MAAYVYLIASTFPFWALPIAFFIFEYANRKRLRGEMKPMWIGFFFASILVALSGAFFYFGAHNNIQPALKIFREGQLQTLW